MPTEQTLPDSEGTTTMNSIINCQSYLMESRADYITASKLTKNYCMYQVKSSDIQSLMNSDRWTHGELLSDIIRNPKIKEDKGARVTVAFVIFFELQQHRAKKKVDKLLGVRYFGVDESYAWDSLGNVVKWVKYLGLKLMKDNPEFVAISWPVDEYDTPLQEALKDEGFKAVKTFETAAKYLFNNDSDENISRIIFTL